MQDVAVRLQQAFRQELDQGTPTTSRAVAKVSLWVL